MRAIFVNHAHPEVRHVSGTRLASFAAALAHRGHEIVLVTSTLSANNPVKTPEQVSSEIASWSWERPYHLACSSLPNWALNAIRQSGQPALIRRAMTLTQMLVHGGVFHDWVEGTAPYWRVLTDRFRPEVVWGTFGNTSNLVLAQSLARRARVPWVMDIKDNWEAFLPSSLRAIIAWRFQDAAALTANSKYHAIIAGKWFPHSAEIIYSGIPAELFAVLPARMGDRAFRVNVIGSIRSNLDIAAFLVGLKNWHKLLAPDQQSLVELVYVGGDEGSFKCAIAEVQWQGRLRILGYLPLQELAGVCKAAAVNCYMWSPVTFHHKLIELFAYGRPIISFPGEHEESIELARLYGGWLSPCPDGQSLERALDRIWTQSRYNGTRDVGAPCDNLRPLTWDVGAIQLEAFFARTLAESPRLPLSPTQ